MSTSEQGVTRDNVLWCFKHLLGRTLDDEVAIAHFLQSESSFESLVNTIVQSVEFRRLSLLSRRPGVGRDGFNYNEASNIQHIALKVLKKLQPKKAAGFEKIRVGARNDGGYIMLDDFSDITAAYSLGINDDIAWDKQIASLGIDVYQYDHTIEALPEENERFHWFKKGIAAQKSTDLDTLSNIMAYNRHDEAKNLVLKCDIEGHEWEMLSNIPTQRLAQFRQIALETHGWGHLDQKEFADEVEDSISNLTRTHSLIHVHANNCASYSIIGGVPIPAVLEMTFARNDCYDLSDSYESFPTKLDAPCNTEIADFFLGTFRFE